METGEEKPLKMEGHTIHFDGFYDLARDVGSTKVLTPPEMRLSKNINTINRDEGLNEILGIMDGCMKDKEMLVKFYSLGPTNSRFRLQLLAHQLLRAPRYNT